MNDPEPEKLLSLSEQDKSDDHVARNNVQVSEELGKDSGDVRKRTLKWKQKKMFFICKIYLRLSQVSTCRAFHRFWQAKIAYGGLVLGSSQFLILTQLPSKMRLASKLVKIDSKIIISLYSSKSLTLSVVQTCQGLGQKIFHGILLDTTGPFWWMTKIWLMYLNSVLIPNL